MPNTKIKTTVNNNSVKEFIAALDDTAKQEDSMQLIAMMQKVSGMKPTMWGPAIIGFGSYHYQYESGREGDMPLIAFSPRKASLTLYLDAEAPARKTLLAKLGKHATSKACLYIKRLADIDLDVLQQLIVDSLKYTKAKYS